MGGYVGQLSVALRKIPGETILKKDFFKKSEVSVHGHLAPSFPGIRQEVMMSKVIHLM